MAKKDPMPHHIKPMLATLHAEPFDKNGWLFEVKWDGYRAIAETEQGSVRLYSRNGKSFREEYPPIVEALQKLQHECVLDGEIVALVDGRVDFHALQRYQERPVPLQYAVFDLLYLDGKDLREQPLRERKALLKKILPKSDMLLYSEGLEEKGTQSFKMMQKNNIEGMVAKDAASPYLEGKRTESWIKVKTQHSQEAIIVGYTEPRGSRKNLGALVLAVYEGKRLRYIGHSGGGFTHRELRDLCQMLSKERVAKSPVEEKVPINSPITWVKPKHVCEVSFTEWTPEGRMRHPIYKGLRPDKKPSEVVREEVKENRVSQKVRRRDGAGGRENHQQGFPRPERDTGSTKQEFTHLDKIFWPKKGYTKGDVIDYYDRMAPVILPYLKDRPLNLNRHPNGIAGKNFFQKNFTASAPDFVRTKKIWSESNNAEISYVLCQNKETLLYLANLGCIEINPWNSRIDSLDTPDYMIIDLDPGENTFDEVVVVAREVQRVLELACEKHYPKTSGKTGMHICVPLGAQYSYDDIRAFAELIATLVHRRIPALTSIERSPAKRKKKIYLDYLQNRTGQTIAAPYSVRPYPGATVSTPLEWREVKKGLDPLKFTINTIEKRVARKGDLWKPVLGRPIDLAASIRCLQKELGT